MNQVSQVYKKIAISYMVAATLVTISLLALTALPRITADSATNHNYIWDYQNNIGTQFVVCKLLLLLTGIVISLMPRFVSWARACNTSREYQPLLSQADETSDLSTAMRDFHNNKMGRGFNTGEVENSWGISLGEKNRFQVAGFISIVMAMISVLVEVWSLFERAQDKKPKDGPTPFGNKAFVGVVILYQNLWFFVAIFMTMLFGTPTSEIREKLVKLGEGIMSRFYREEELTLPRVETLPLETVLTCQRFLQYHKSACVSAIGHHVEGAFGQVYTDVFAGEQLVSWLINVGLVEDREEGVEYGGRLLLGRVLEHIDKRRSFHDRDYLYRLVRLPTAVPESDTSGESGDNFQVRSRNSRSLPDWF